MADKKNATEDTAPVDLAKFDGLVEAQDEGVDVEIQDPAGNYLGFAIRVAGPDSKVQKAAQAEEQTLRLRKRNNPPPTPEELRAASLRVAAAATLGWSKLKLDGGDYPFSRENAQALYVRFPFIFEQVQAAAGSRADFLSK